GRCAPSASRASSAQQRESSWRRGRARTLWPVRSLPGAGYDESACCAEMVSSSQLVSTTSDLAASGARSLSGLEGADLVEVGPDDIFPGLQVVPGLQVEPKPVTGSEVPGLPKGSVRGDAALAVHDLVDAPRWHTDRDGQMVLGDAQGLDELLEQYLPGV